jgi:hypothetical protein
MLASAHSVRETARLMRLLSGIAKARLSIWREVALSRVRGNASTNRLKYTRAFRFPACLLITLLATVAFAQEPNPVVRKVDNPVTDTPYVNPLQQDQPVRPPAGKAPPIQAGDSLETTCANESSVVTKEGRISTCEGNVDARIGTYRLQADKVTVYEARNLVVADGNVVFDQGDQQRITGAIPNGITKQRQDSSMPRLVTKPTTARACTSLPIASNESITTIV